MNKFEKQIFDMYEKINIGKCGSCQNCRNHNPELSLPISIWQVGDEYYSSKYKVLFVGKVARGNPGEKRGCFMDATKRADELFETSGWAYWNYTKAIANSLYYENAWEKIAFTNMVKCNNSDTIDTTNDLIRNCCLPIIKEEIRILNPKNIVFYTKGYNTLVEKLFDDIMNSKTECVPIGKKEMCSLTFNGVISNSISRVIIVGHPERMKKEDYINHIVNFIKQ